MLHRSPQRRPSKCIAAATDMAVAIPWYIRPPMAHQSSDPAGLRTVCELLADHFAADEFRRFIEAVDEAAARELPGGLSSQTALIADGVACLRRRGLIDARFFQVWAGHRPLRRSEIFAAASALGIAALGATAAVAPSSASSGAPTRPDHHPDRGCNPWVLVALFVILLVTLIVFLGLRDSPFRVEYAVAVFLICSAILFAALRQYFVAAAALLVGLVILFWTARRADRQRALPA
jgi:hypothetical protein